MNKKVSASQKASTHTAKKHSSFNLRTWIKDGVSHVISFFQDRVFHANKHVSKHAKKHPFHYAMGTAVVGILLSVFGFTMMNGGVQVRAQLQPIENDTLIQAQALINGTDYSAFDMSVVATIDGDDNLVLELIGNQLG